MTKPHLSPTQLIGREAEDRAAKYLIAKGYRIVTQNYWCPEGEIDLVALDGKELVFVEVKVRKNEEYGHPVETVTTKKLQKIHRAARQFIEEYQFRGYFRYDIVTLLPYQIDHFENVTL